jgi:hypothetical protein
MLIKNHLFVSLVLTGITLTISNASLASEPTSFTSLSACRNHFNTVVQAGNQSTEASDPWCKARMSALDFCTEMALLNSIATTSYNSSQIPALRQSLQTSCQQQLAAQQSSPPAGAPTGGSGTAGAAFNASGAPVPPTPPAQQNCTVVPASEQAACNVRLAQYQRDLQTYQSNLQAFNQRQAAAQQQQQQQAQQEQQQRMQAGMQGTQMMLGAMAPLLNGSSGNGTQQMVTTRTTLPDGTVIERLQPVNPNSPFTQGTAAEASNNLINQVNQNLTANGNPALPQNASQIQQAATQGAADVRNANLGENVTRAADDAARSANTTTSAGDQARTQEISGLSEEQRNQRKAITDRARQTAQTISSCAPAAAAAINRVNDAFDTFDAQKVKCVQDAERTNMLCLEGSSPGIRAAKTLMDVSGPVLAMIGSAQKACSSTRKVTNLAMIGLTAAKGVCVASKLMCDASCASTRAKLETIFTGLRTGILAGLRADMAAAGTDTQKQACVQGHQTTVQTTIQSYGPIQLNENSINGGTTAGLIASCQNKARDILGMATNIMGMAMAKMSAQKCEKQLASSAGAAGASGDVSTADYCSNPATSGSQFCKCQSNPTAEGCSGSLAAGGLVGDANNQRGANLKAGQGPNGFAGGGARAGGGSDFNLRGGNGTDSSGAALAGLEAGGSAFGGGTNGALGGSVAGSGGSGAAGTAGLAAGTDKAADKKWNFGAFAATGGGGASARGASALGNGNLSSQQQEAIERKIASEKYAAEITTSSGKSNFDKIKSAVRQISSTLDPNQ